MDSVELCNGPVIDLSGNIFQTMDDLVKASTPAKLWSDLPPARIKKGSVFQGLLPEDLRSAYSAMLATSLSLKSLEKRQEELVKSLPSLEEESPSRWIEVIFRAGKEKEYRELKALYRQAGRLQALRDTIKKLLKSELDYRFADMDTERLIVGEDWSMFTSS